MAANSLLSKSVAAIALLLLLAGCGFQAQAPQRTAAPAVPPVPLTSLSASLVIPVSQLTRLLTDMTQYQIADIKDKPVKCGPVACRLSLHASRTGPLTVAADGGRLGVQIPFAANASVAASGLLSFLHGQAQATGIVDAQTRIAISPDLQLHSETEGTVRLDNGHLRIGPVVTNIADIWNANEDSLSRPLWRAMDKQVAKLPIRPRVQKFWSDAFRPVRASKSPTAWLAMRPEQLRVAAPQVRDGKVVLSLALAGRVNVAVQEAPPDNAPTRLPRAGTLGAPSDTFSAAVPVVLPYDQASRLALASLQKRPVKAAGLAVTFSRLDFLPSGQDLVVLAHLCVDPKWDVFGWFASCGDVYLRGVPMFDSDRKVIRVEHLHFDLGSAGLMLRVLGAVAEGELTQLLQSRLVFHETGPINRLESQITQLLAKPQGRDISVSAKIDSFGTPRFTWTTAGFWVLFTARGRLHTDVAL